MTVKENGEITSFGGNSGLYSFRHPAFDPSFSLIQPQPPVVGIESFSHIDAGELTPVAGACEEDFTEDEEDLVILIGKTIYEDVELGTPRHLADGAMNRVYFVKWKGQNYVLKVELLYENGQSTETISPWVHFGDKINAKKRQPFNKNITGLAKERQTEHLRVARILEECGFRVPRFFGSLILPGVGKSDKEHPLYAELWEYPGKSTENHSLVTDLYSTSGGRVELTNFARSLLDLSKRGYSNDFVPRQNKSDKEFAHPKNILVTNDEEIYVIDFNHMVGVVGDILDVDDLTDLVLVGKDGITRLNGRRVFYLETKIREVTSQNPKDSAQKNILYKYLFYLQQQAILACNIIWDVRQ